MPPPPPDPPRLDVRLRDVHEADLPIFFEHQRDPDATEMAGFPARAWDAFMAHWAKILADATTINQTILVDEQVAGNIACWEQHGERAVGYWIGKSFWGRGVASAALAMFLRHVAARPLHAHVVRHNHASMRVLEKCGFVVCGEDDEERSFILKAKDCA